MTEDPSTSSSAEARPAQLVQTARRGAALAQRLTTGVAVLAGASGGAGLLLWGLLWWPMNPRPLVLAGAGVTLLFLLGPAAILALFYQGLYDLQALPERLSEHARRTKEESAKAVQTATDASSSSLGWLWRLIKQIWALRTVLIENRALLFRYGALLRFVTPGFLLLVLGAAGVSLLLIPVSAAAGLIVLLG